jgi:hypothetical protein
MSRIGEVLERLITPFEVKIAALQKQNYDTGAELDYLKELADETNRHANGQTDGNVYLLLYVKDNGEGCDTWQCCGVFTTKAEALKYRMKMVKNYNIPPNMIEVDQYTMPEDWQSDLYQVYHIDYEDHCETATHILGIEGQDALCDSRSDVKDAYKVPFKANEFVWD